MYYKRVAYIPWIQKLRVVCVLACVLCTSYQEISASYKQDLSRRITLNYIPEPTIPLRSLATQIHQMTLYKKALLHAKTSEDFVQSLVQELHKDPSTRLNSGINIFNKLIRRLCRNHARFPDVFKKVVIGNIIGEFLEEYITCYYQKELFGEAFPLRVRAYRFIEKHSNIESAALILKSDLQHALSKKLKLTNCSMLVISAQHTVITTAEEPKYTTEPSPILPDILFTLQYREFAHIQISFTQDYAISPPFSVLTQPKYQQITSELLKGIGRDERSFPLVHFMRRRLQCKQDISVVPYCTWCSRPVCPATLMALYCTRYRSVTKGGNPNVCTIINCTALPLIGSHSMSFFSTTPRILLQFRKFAH